MSSTKRIFEETENGYNYYEETTSITVHEVEDNTTTAPVYRTTTTNTTTVTVEVIDLTTESEEESGNSRKKRKTENVPENFPEEIIQNIPEIVSESEYEQEEVFEECSLCYGTGNPISWHCMGEECSAKVCSECIEPWTEMKYHPRYVKDSQGRFRRYSREFNWKCFLCARTTAEILNLR